MENKAAWLESEKGKFVVRETELAQPGEGEVLIKVRAVAIQPADAKVAKHAVVKMEYPTILGFLVSGTVEALGSGVSKVAVGDRVASPTKVLVHKKPKYGGLQRFTIVDEFAVVEIGDTDFAKAANLTTHTPPSILFAKGSLNMHRPTIPASPLPASEQGKKIIIWAGSSAMGALCISYAKQAGYEVITTCSPHNFDLVRSLGADHVFDHSAPQSVDQIRNLFPIDYWLDTFSSPVSLTTILKILAPDGGPVTKAHILTLLPPTMPGMPALPEGVTAKIHMHSTLADENREWREWALSKGGFLEKAIKGGLIKGVPTEVPGGLDKVDEAIERVYNGVSARKIILDPWA